MTTERTFLGSDNVHRSLAAHLQYLEGCAKRWDEAAKQNIGQSDKSRAEARAQAQRVRDMITRLREENP